MDQIPEQTSAVIPSHAEAESSRVHSRTFSIAVLAGDGIGPEVMAEAILILRALEGQMPGIRLDLQDYPAGATEYLRNGDPLPERTLSACRRADAVLLGAMGLPSVRWPDGKEMTPQVDLREKLDLYCGLRPVRLYNAADTPLKGYQPGEIDLVIIRESTEGLFSSRLVQTPRDADEVEDRLRVSRKGSERLFRAAFRQAQKRRRRLTLVDKANVLPSMVLFRSIFDSDLEQGVPCLSIDPILRW